MIVKQNHQRLPARQQVFQAGIDADGGEKVNQQDVPCRQIEIDLDAADQVQQRNQQGKQQAAGDRLRYAEFPEKTDGVIDTLANKQHDNPQGNREKGAELQNTVFKFHGLQRLNAPCPKVYGCSGLARPAGVSFAYTSPDDRASPAFVNTEGDLP